MMKMALLNRKNACFSMPLKRLLLGFKCRNKLEYRSFALEPHCDLMTSTKQFSFSMFQHCSTRSLYDSLLKIDLRCLPLPFQTDEFDIVTCVETLEYLQKNVGRLLIEEMERIANNKVIITSVNWFYRQPLYNGNPFQQHLSLWTSKEMAIRGYRIKGVGEFLFIRKPISYLSFILAPLTHTLKFNFLAHLSSSYIAVKELSTIK